MKRIKNKKYFYTGKYDVVFKAVFTLEENMSMLKEFLKRLLKREVYEVEVKRNEITKEYILEKGRMLDLLLEVDGEVIHIEMNVNPKEYYHVRNYSYFSTIFNRHVKVGEKYDLKTKFKHIDLTYGLKDSKEYRIYPTKDDSKKDRKKYLENFEIIEYNLDKIMGYYYSKNERKIKEYDYLIMLDLNKEELKRFSKERNEEFMSKYAKKVIEVNQDPEFIPFLTREEDYKFTMNTERWLGIEQGEDSAQKRIIKNMLKNNVDVKTISKYIGISVNEVESYKDSIIC